MAQDRAHGLTDPRTGLYLAPAPSNQELVDFLSPHETFAYTSPRTHSWSQSDCPDHYLISTSQENHIVSAFGNAFSDVTNINTQRSPLQTIALASQFAVQLVCFVERGGTPPKRFHDEVSCAVMIRLQQQVGALDGEILFKSKTYPCVAYLRLMFWPSISAPCGVLGRLACPSIPTQCAVSLRPSQGILGREKIAAIFACERGTICRELSCRPPSNPHLRGPEPDIRKAFTRPSSCESATTYT